MTAGDWEEGLRGAISDAAGATLVMAPPTETIVGRGRASVRRRNAAAWSGGVVAAVTATVIVAGLANGNVAGGASTPGASASPGTSKAVHGGDGQAVVVMGKSTAKATVVVFDDYRCEACKELNDVVGPVLEQEVAAGQVRVEYRPVDLMDGFGGQGSVVAGNAVQCAAESGHFYAFRDALFRSQPSERNDAYGTPQAMINLARTIGGLDSKSFEDCVRAEPYAGGVRDNYSQLSNAMKIGFVPYVKIGAHEWPQQRAGQLSNSQIIQSLRDALDAAAK